MNEKFEVVEVLSKRGEDILNLAVEYKKESRDIIKDAIKRAIEADYGKKFDVSLLDSLEIEKIENLIREDKYFRKNAEEITAEAVAFAEKYFKGDCITILPEGNLKIKICRKYGIKRSQIPIIFGVKTEREIQELWQGGFVKTFVDKYVRTNIMRILEAEESYNKGTYSFEVGKVYFNERFYNIDVSIIVSVNGLTSDILYWFKDILKMLRKVY